MINTPVSSNKNTTTVVGCLSGIPTYLAQFQCEAGGPIINGSGTNTKEVSYFYQLDAATKKVKVLDWDATIPTFVPSPCMSATNVMPSQVTEGYIVDPDAENDDDKVITANREIPRNPDTGLLDYSKMTYKDDKTGDSITMTGSAEFVKGTPPSVGC